MAKMKLYPALLAFFLMLLTARVYPDDAGTPAPLGVFQSSSGKIVSIDALKHELVIDTLKGPLVFIFDRNTVVYSRRHIGTLSDLRPGMAVRFSYGNGAGTSRLDWIEEIDEKRLTATDGGTPDKDAGVDASVP